MTTRKAASQRPSRTKPAGVKQQTAATHDDVEAIKDSVQTLRDRQHAAAQLDTIKTFLVAEVAKLKAEIPAPIVATPVPDLPKWAKLTFASVAGLVSVCVLGSFIYAGIASYGGSRVDGALLVGKITTLEQTVAAYAPLPGRVQQLDTKLETATSIRNQQMQGMVDRLRLLEQTDQQGVERLNQLTTTIAGIIPRLEEVLRRQERLENRLTNPVVPRPNGSDIPVGPTREMPANWRHHL